MLNPHILTTLSECPIPGRPPIATSPGSTPPKKLCATLGARRCTQHQLSRRGNSWDQPEAAVERGDFGESESHLKLSKKNKSTAKSLFFSRIWNLEEMLKPRLWTLSRNRLAFDRIKYAVRWRAPWDWDTRMSVPASHELLSSIICIYIYMYIHSAYIYIYIYTVHIYIYIFCNYISIYIYIPVISRDNMPVLVRRNPENANLATRLIRSSQ